MNKSWYFQGLIARMLVHPINNRGKIRLNNEFLPKNPFLEEDNSRALITICSSASLDSLIPTETKK